MQLTSLRLWWDSLSRFEKAALAIWCVVLLSVSVRVYFWPAKQTVYPIFSGSAQLWWGSEDLYEPGRPKTVQDGYRYSPTFAILLTPFALLPDSAGGVIWRLVSMAAIFASLVWFSQSVLPLSLSRGQFALLTLCCLPLTVQSLNNGQANLIVVAAMLGAMAAVKEQRWNIASALLALAFVCKVYPLALGMLLVLLYPRQLFWRLPLAIAGSLMVPFFLQDPDYVIDQYSQWIALLRADDRSSSDMLIRHRDLWLLIDLYGIPISRRVYVLMQLGGGFGVAMLCWGRQRQSWPETSLLTSTLALAVTWMMLLGPVVESSTFVLLAPSLAGSMIMAYQRRPGAIRLSLLAGSAFLFLIAVLFGSVANTAKLNIAGIHPWATLLYFIYLLTETPPPKQEALAETKKHRAAA